MRILVDINVPKKVCEELREIGINAIYLTDVLPSDVDDEKILRWMTDHDALILTRDKNFPGDDNGRKEVLVCQSPKKILKEALRKFAEKRPEGLR